ncbi:MAG: heat-inducible transcriptional repressor HrcA [Fimbriimonadales bacterium]
MPKRTQPVPMLDARKSAILKAVVRDHVATGEPVGSHAIATRYPLGVKPATIRNEMAEMTDWGYLLQPHTSAGRVPSTLGYRYYVEHLRAKVSSLKFERYLQRLPQPGESLTELLASTLSILARVAHSASFATTAQDDTLRLIRCVITHCGPHRALVVGIFEHGFVENRLVDLKHSTSQRSLHRIQNVLIPLVEGQTVRYLLEMDPEQVPSMESPAERETLSLLLRTVQSIAQEASEGELYYDGVAFILQQPEFQREVSQLEAVLRTLDERKALYRLVERTRSEMVTLQIGEENPLEPLRCCTLIYTRYRVGNRISGVLGVLGPMRMDYDRTITAVDQTAQALSDVLTKTLYS